MGQKWHLRAGNCNFFYGKGKDNHQFGAEFSVHHNIVSAVKIVKFVRDKLL